MSEPSRRIPRRPELPASSQPEGLTALAASSTQLMVLAGALIASAAALFLATSSWLLALAFLLGVGVLLGAGLVFDRLRIAPAQDQLAPPDWTVTVAAIEQAGEAVAITDRANRLVCANSEFLENFGVSAAPPALPFAREALEVVTRLARDAWRDGAAVIDLLPMPDGEFDWQISARRAGRGEDHLVWRLRPLPRVSKMSLGALDLAGPFGKMLSRAGIETAITTADGIIRAVSAGFAERAAGDDRATLMGQDFVSYLRTDERDRIFFAREGRGPSTSGDAAVRLVNSPEEPVSLGLAGVRGLGEAAVLLSLADSSQENQLRRQVAQATKMQAVGQLAGGVAHDFNNVLTAIIGTCDLMLLRHIPGDSDYDDIQQIRANSNRAAALTRQLLAFSRQQTLRPEVIQLPDVVSEVSPLIKRLLGEKIIYYVQHDRNLGPVRADPQQLEQVIMNLAVNARDAIQSRGKGTGRISLFTRHLHATEVVQLGSEVLPAADYTVLIVQDTGGGIPPHVLPKLFEPFFTTKEQGKGTGLGLSTAYGIVKQSGGFIFADNIKDKAGHPTGACFTVYFPVHHGEAHKKRETRAPLISSEWSVGGKVLLVEDEDMVRAVAERALARAGYDVKACANGEEGLAAITEGTVQFDIVVSDVVMPGMDGPAMVRAIRARLPKMPVLFMSGYAEEQLRRDIDIPDMHFIPKPFSVAAIGDKVGAVLSQARAEQAEAEAAAK